MGGGASKAYAFRPELLQNAKKVLENKGFKKNVDDLQKCIQGKVLTPMDEIEYNIARNRPFNHDARGYPLAIIQVKCKEDVITTTRFISTFGRPGILCVTCGAHSIRCMKSGSFVIDLQYLNKVEIDPELKIGRIGGGACLHQLDDACAPYGLCTTLGTYPNTGIGGMTLSGGYGWLARTFGYAVDNLIAAEVVLPDGILVYATADNSYADLLWGLKGGGGNFGIVVTFVFQLHSLPSTVMGGLMVHLTPTLPSKLTFLKNFDQLIQTDPPGVTGAIVLIPAPVMPTVWTYFGEAKSYQEVPALVAAHKLGGWFTLGNTIKKCNYHTHIQKILVPFQESGFRYDSVIPIGSVDEPLPESFLHDVIQHTSTPLNKAVLRASIVMFAMGGACTQLDQGRKTCLSQDFRKARYFCVLEASWKPEYGETGKHAAQTWTREAHRILSSHKTIQTTYSLGELNNDNIEDNSSSYQCRSSLTSTNMMGGGGNNVPLGTVDEGEENLEDDEDTKQDFCDMNAQGYIALYDELLRLKKKYDGRNFLRQNVNIALKTPVTAKTNAKESLKWWNDLVKSKTPETATMI